MTWILLKAMRFPKLTASLIAVIAAATLYAFVYQRGAASERLKAQVAKYESVLAGKNAQIEFLKKTRAAVEAAARKDLELARQDADILRELYESGESIVDDIKDEFVCVDPVSTDRLRSLFKR